ncbi:MAG: helix-turn-helix domain-containing protein [Propionicimonas sp.]
MERDFDAFSADCPSRDLVEHVTSRWSSLVLVALLDNPRRFAETARTVDGISDRMLSRTLATLAEDGLVTRVELGGQHVEYRLTSTGRPIATALRGVVDAVYAAMPEVLAARDAAQR